MGEESVEFLRLGDEIKGLSATMVPGIQGGKKTSLFFINFLLRLDLFFEINLNWLYFNCDET